MIAVNANEVYNYWIGYSKNAERNPMPCDDSSSRIEVRVDAAVSLEQLDNLGGDRVSLAGADPDGCS